MARGKGLSILERNQRVIGLVALALIVAGTVFALLLQGGFLTPSYTVTAMFADAAGIRSGDNVTVAGLPAGKVQDVRIEEGRVAMDLSVEQDVELPADSGAEVRIETVLGRKSVALIPGEGDEPLRDGDVIPLDRTMTPVTVTELNDISVDLLTASDAEAFETFLRDVANITKGKARDVRGLIGGLEKVTAAVDARRDQLAGLIDSLRTLSATLGERDQTIVSLIDNLDAVMGSLALQQGELEALLENTAAASAETADLVRRNRGGLDRTLRRLHVDLSVIDQHQLDLAAGIAYLNQAVEGYSSVGYSQGVPNHWANIFVQSLGPVGVDALVGRCGLVDQLFDEFFGTECDAGGGGGGGGGGSEDPDEELGEGPPPPPELPTPEDVPAAGLPCTIEDLVGSVLTGTGAGPEERCQG